MKIWLSFLLGLVIGVCLMLTFRRPSQTERVEVYRFDTVQIPKPMIQYRDRWSVITKVNVSPIEMVRYFDAVKSVIDTPNISIELSKIPVNCYSDSIDFERGKLKYNIETVGFLSKFEPVVELKPDKIFHWSGVVGVSDKLNLKTGIGYDGWLAEIEFNKKMKFNQLYISKQFKF